MTATYKPFHDDGAVVFGSTYSVFVTSEGEETEWPFRQRKKGGEGIPLSDGLKV